jgi:hydrogenase maturation protease
VTGPAGAATEPARAVVIGVGNEFRRDDGIGPAVAGEIGGRDLPGIRVVWSDGDPAALLEAWDGVDLAIVVDAVRLADPAPGRVHKTTAGPWLRGAATSSAATGSAGAAGGAASSHGLGVPDALLLGQALGRLPGRLVVFAVEAASVDLGVGLSPQVAAAAPAVVSAVLAELGHPAGT